MNAPRGPGPARSFFRRRSVLIFLGLTIIVLVGVRLALPSLIKGAANARLNELPNHHAHIEAVSLSLFRGAYQLEGLTVVPRGAGTDPLLSVDRIDMSLAWRALFRGRIVADLVIEKPVLTLEPGLFKTEEGMEDVADKIPLVEINRIEIRHGILRYRDLEQSPPVDLALHNVSATIEDLVFGSDENRPARADLHAFAPGDGHFRIAGTVHPSAASPRFEIAAELSESDLTAYTDLVRAHLGVDVSSGKLHLAFEASAKDGRYEGYVKPLIRNARFDEPEEGPLKTVWTSIVNFVTETLKNDETRQMGTRVPFEGNFEETDIEAWPSFVTLLRNAFGQALREGVDGEPASSAR